MSATRLIVIAGASGSGKSTLIERLRSRSISEVCDRLGIRDPESWERVFARSMWRGDESKGSRVLLHYDLLRSVVLHGLKQRPFEDDAALAIMTSAEEVSILTLWVPPVELVRRLATKRRALVKSFFHRSDRPTRPLRKLRQLSLKLQILRDRRRFRDLFESWLSFCAASPARTHWISLPCGESYVLQSAAGWTMSTGLG